MAWKLDHFFYRRSFYRFAGDTFTPTSRVMKLAMVLLAVAGAATCSLEPAGYLSPTQSHSTMSSHYQAALSHDVHSHRQHFREYEQYEPARYDFGYRVRDNRGNDYGHQEARDGTRARGSYFVVLPDGRKQIVEYEADEGGFRPRISYVKSDAGRGDAFDGHSAYPGSPY